MIDPNTMAKRSSHDFSGQRMAAARFMQRWKELAAQGAQPAVISRFKHPELWLAWRAYYRAKGLMGSLDLMDDGRHETTVPCLDPADFESVTMQPDRRVKDD